ncbi:MAG TPA: hypothetical protein VFN53_05875 [Acidobacteriaceae bacterium]|nr:hypothetical protein [Acidobacteriaceae bacterium]
MTFQRKLVLAMVFLALSAAAVLYARTPGPAWRAATPDELKTIIPARAPVGSERIETEMRTASGVTDGKGKFIAGVVLITAGYSADGKYSHFFLCQAPVSLGTFTLPPGQYALGWHRQNDDLKVGFYEAATGKLIGTVDATREAGSRVTSFRMTPPGEDPHIYIGRFSFKYQLQRNRK